VAPWPTWQHMTLPRHSPAWSCGATLSAALGKALIECCPAVVAVIVGRRSSGYHCLCRVGNHPFAKDYSSTVPDSWAVINGAHATLPWQAACCARVALSAAPADQADMFTGQDVVTRGAKFGVYKRCAEYSSGCSQTGNAVDFVSSLSVYQAAKQLSGVCDATDVATECSSAAAATSWYGVLLSICTLTLVYMRIAPALPRSTVLY
jgi:hypothetical protein